MNFPYVAVMTRVNGKLVPLVRDREKFYNWLEHQFKEGQKVWLSVTKPSRSRTHEQFKYLYKMVYEPIAEYTGMSMDETDGVMKKRHLTVNEDSRLEYVRNKTDLDRAELAKYIDDCRKDAASMGITTQDPI
jgi:hypothetical protein